MKTTTRKPPLFLPSKLLVSMFVAAQLTRERYRNISENPSINERKSKRHRAAALQNLAEVAALWNSRQRLGVRQPHAAFVAHTPMDDCVHRPRAALSESLGSLQVGGYALSGCLIALLALFCGCSGKAADSKEAKKMTSPPVPVVV